ncbi:hypothetical protein ACFV0C_12600 [Streptomyces sp. NPDC059568]|uniref:hypothetical protein n=1 Tax=Streptomyces sp. NPDC059568 TaxID=3346868 RepID=UPI0036791B78
MAVDTAGRTRAIGQAIRQDLRAVGASARILADEPPDGAREGPERRRLERTPQGRH